ncbi:hypothetical protein Goarm_021842 [Gossypium armourianum]|uniref:DUF4283 domain-containing protein n=1 Tax=Gossypium armourianum TaxID=34283 RepID=A0A7J9IT07_9ROSI|nr:hypothetical protein [Gossypium armourianum]
MADLWHPIGGICIIDLGNKRYLFQFFNEVDIQRVISGLMSESMAKQFGDFLGKFLDYDASILFLSQATHMRIRVRLDKLSLFCFIYGKLGHGESYPFRLRMEPSKISFGWDLSLHAVPRQRNTVVSRWLRKVDGSQCCADIMGSTNQRNSFNCKIDSGRIIGRDFGKQMSNPNLILLGSNQQYFINGNNN